MLPNDVDQVNYKFKVNVDILPNKIIRKTLYKRLF